VSRKIASFGGMERSAPAGAARLTGPVLSAFVFRRIGFAARHNTMVSPTIDRTSMWTGARGPERG